MWGKMNLSLIYPMFALVILTFIVFILGFAARFSAVRTRQLPLRYFKVFEGGAPPEAVVKTARHYSNLFEMPVLYYVGLILAMLIPLTGFWITFWAWGFVVARIAHACVHLGTNNILQRM